MAYQALTVVNLTGSAQKIIELGLEIEASGEVVLDFISKGRLIAEEALAEIETKVNSDIFVVKIGVTQYSKANSLIIIDNIYNNASPSLNPLVSHASTHEDGGTDEINVAGLSGKLADNQKADLASADVTGILPIAKGGTGSATQNFVDLTTAQSVGGVKTFTAKPVSAGDATGNELVNYTQVESLVANGPQGAPVADITALKAIDTTNVPDGQVRAVIAEEAEYVFNIAATDTEDLPNIVDPTTGSGRWFFQRAISQNHNNLTNLQGGGVGDYQHLTSTELGDIPTPDEKDALAGTGTPSAANPYVNNDDSRLTDARAPTAHASTHENGGSDEIEIANLSSVDTSTAKYLRPDGVGGVEFVTLPTAASTVEVGTTAPTTTDGTIMWLNTNTNFNSTMMYRDQRVSKWLSIETMDLAFGADSADNSYLSLAGISTPGDRSSYRLRLNGTIVGIAARARTGNLTKNFEVRVNGAAIAGGDFTLAGGVYTSNTRDHNVVAGDDITVYADATGAPVRDVEVLLIIKWRA